MFNIIKTQIKIYSMFKATFLESASCSVDGKTEDPSAVEKSFSDITSNFGATIKAYKDKVKSGETLSQEDKEKISQAVILAEKQIRELTICSLSNERKRNQIIFDIESTKAELLNSFGATRTKEQISKYDSKFLGQEVSTGVSRAETIKSFSATTKVSLQNILKSSDLIKVAAELKELAPIGKIKNKDGSERDGVVFGTFYDSTKFEEKLKSLGYEVDGIRLDSEELTAVYQTIQDYAYNQENLPRSPEEQFKLLIDFDRDGNLGTNVNFSVGEAQFYYSTFKALSSDGINAVMGNLGFKDMETFSGEMSTNFFSARERFQRVLGTFIERGVKPGDLVKKGGVDKYFKNLQKIQDNITMKVENELDRNKLLEQKLSTITDLKQREEAKNKIKLAAIGLMVGSKYGVGASFDVKEFTNHFIDAIQIGMVGLFPVIGISKNIFSSWDKSVNFNLSTIGPSVDATKVFKVSENHGLAVSGAVSIIGGVGTLGYEDISIDSSVGIEKEMSYMQEDLKKLKEAILSRKKSGIEYKNQSMIDTLYNDFNNAVSLYATKGKEGDFLDGLITAFLTSYKNELYNQAKGFKFTSSGVGVIVPFFHSVLIPFVYAGGEYISQKYSKFNHRIQEERETTTTKEIKFDDLEIEKYKAKDGKEYEVYSISEKSSFYNISSADGKVQAERKGGKLYISGKIDGITIDEHVTANGVSRTIVINGGQKQKNGTYVGADLLPITSNIFEDGSKVTNRTSKEILNATKEAANSTEEIRKTLFNLVGEDALNHPKTVGMQKLQKMIFDYSHGKGDLDDVWNQLKIALNHKGFSEYVGTNGKTDLSKLLNNLKEVSSDEKKVLILQTIQACFMKKPGLKVNNEGNINVGKKLKEHDKRGNFFDKILVKEFPDLSGEISIARQKWFNANGDATSYKFRQVDDGSIAFSANESLKSNGQKNISGVMPYSGVYNVVDAGTRFIDIPKKSNKVIENLPKSYLESLRKTLETRGVKLKDEKSVIDFIKNGGDSKMKIDYKLAYCKMGECMNDAVVLKVLEINPVGQGSEPGLKIGASLTSEVYVAENDVDKYGVVVTGEKQKIKIGGDKDDGNGSGNGPNGTIGGGGNPINVDNSGGGNIGG